VSPGCDRCYAERVTQRFLKTFPNGFDLTLRPDAVELPLHWRRPRMIFVNSMSDLFHVDVPESFIRRVFEVMIACPQHTFQILTKRAERLARLAPRLPWPTHVWMGVSIESPAYRWRVRYLQGTPAAIKFVSAEPLLASIPDLDLVGIHWLIAGGESQPGCRPARPQLVQGPAGSVREYGHSVLLKAAWRPSIETGRRRRGPRWTSTHGLAFKGAGRAVRRTQCVKSSERIRPLWGACQRESADRAER
jgi:protein gp37